MLRNFLVSLLGLLTVAGMVLGQPPEAVPSLEVPPLPPPSEPQLFPTQAVTPGSRPPAYWFPSAQVEYLLWFLQREQLGGNLATTNTNLTPTAIPGNLSRDLTGRPLSGARFTLGYWYSDYDPMLESCQRIAAYGVEANGFFLGERSISVTSGSSSQLFRPFFNLNDGVVDAVVVASPGLAVGELSALAKFEMSGAEANAFCNVFSNPISQTLRIDLLGGFRNLNLDGSILINQRTQFSQNIPANSIFQPLAGSRINSFDYFGVENNYFGGQVGMRIQAIFGCVTAGTTLKYGIGTNHQRLTIDGGQLLTGPGGVPQTQSVGGLLALPSNIGSFTQNRFAQVPEADFKLTVNLTDRISVHGGFAFLYFNRVIRAVNQIDRTIDITQIPNFPGGAAATPTGLGRPGVFFKESGLLVQALHFGVTFAW